MANEFGRVLADVGRTGGLPEAVSDLAARARQMRQDEEAARMRGEAEKRQAAQDQMAAEEHSLSMEGKAIGIEMSRETLAAQRAQAEKERQAQEKANKIITFDEISKKDPEIAREMDTMGYFEQLPDGTKITRGADAAEYRKTVTSKPEWQQRMVTRKRLEAKQKMDELSAQLEAITGKAKPGTNPMQNPQALQLAEQLKAATNEHEDWLERDAALQDMKKELIKSGKYTGEQIQKWYETGDASELIPLSPGKTSEYERLIQIVNDPNSTAAEVSDARARMKFLATKPAGGQGSSGLDMAKYPRIAKLMSEGFFPSSGRVTPAWIQSMEAAAMAAEGSGNPWDVETARRFEFETQKNTATGRTAGTRLVVARAQNIDAAFELLDDMEKTGSKLNLSKNKFAAAAEQWANKGGIAGDPVTTEYFTQRADALFVLGNALKQNGLTDKAIQVEEEAARPTMDPATLRAYINTQRRALNRAASEMNKDYRMNVKQTPVVEAGVGGAGERKMPAGSSEKSIQSSGGETDYKKLYGLE